MSQSITSDDGDLEEELAQLLEENEGAVATSTSREIDVDELENQLKNLRLPDAPKQKPSLSQSVVSL